MGDHHPVAGVETGDGAGRDIDVLALALGVH